MNVKLLIAMFGVLLLSGCAKHDQQPSPVTIQADSTVSLAEGTRCLRLPANLSADLVKAAQEHTRIAALEKAAKARDAVLAQELRNQFGKKGYSFTVTEDKQSVIMERCLISHTYGYATPSGLSWQSVCEEGQ